MRCLLRIVPALSCAGLLAAQSNFPPPPAPSGNPVTAEKALLGMALFWEEQLSSTDTVACGTCHAFTRGGCDGRALTSLHPGRDGVFGTGDDTHGSPGVAQQSAAHVYPGSTAFGFAPQVTPRRTPSVVNAGYHPALFYDGRAASGEFRDPVGNAVLLTGNVALENLVLQPPLNPVEMGHPGRTWTDVARKLAAAEPLALASNLPSRLYDFVAGQGYPALFQRAFGTPDVTPARIAMAIASYIRTLNADQTPWDEHLTGNRALTTAEAQGLALFTTPPPNGVACSTCHGDFEPRVRTEGPIVGQMTTIGPTGPYSSPSQPVRLLFHNVGVQAVAADAGRQAITNQTGDRGKFRVASLRNVALSAPYYHNGSMATLDDVLQFYERGGDFHDNQAPGLVTRQLGSGGRAAVITLLDMLTDPRLQQQLPPFDRPTLGSENGNVPLAFGRGSLLAAGGRAHAFAPHACRLGDPAFTVIVDGIEPAAFGMLLVDTAIVPGGWSLYSLEFTIALSPRCTSMVASVAQPTQHGSNAIAATFAIPNAPALRNVSLAAQWLFTDSAGTIGLATSDALPLHLR